MLNYDESSVSVIQRMMSTINVKALNGLIRKINQVNETRGIERITWMTIHNHARGARILSDNSLGKIAYAMQRIKDPKKRELVDLSHRLIRSAEIEKTVLYGDGTIDKIKLTGKQIERVKRLRRDGIAAWERDKSGVKVNAKDIASYIKQSEFSSISIIKKIATLIPASNLNQLISKINTVLAKTGRESKLSSSVLYSHTNDLQRVISEESLHLIAYAMQKITHPRQTELHHLALKLTKASEVEKYALANPSNASRRIMKIRGDAIVLWKKVAMGTDIKAADVAAYLKSGYTSVSLVKEIMANLSVMSLNKLTEIINRNIKDKLNGTALYTHMTSVYKIISKDNLQRIEEAMRAIRHPRRAELQHLVAKLKQATAVERFLILRGKELESGKMGSGRLTAKARKVLQRRKKEVEEWNGEIDPNSYQESSVALMGEIMRIMGTEYPDHFIARMNTEIARLNKGRKVNKIGRLSQGIVYKHMVGQSILSSTSLQKMEVVMQNLAHPEKKALLTLVRKLSAAARTERAVMEKATRTEGFDRRTLARVERIKRRDLTLYRD